MVGILPHHATRALTSALSYGSVCRYIEIFNAISLEPHIHSLRHGFSTNIAVEFDRRLVPFVFFGPC